MKNSRFCMSKAGFLSLAGAAMAQVQAQDTKGTAGSEAHLTEEVFVAGFRQSLVSATAAKRESVNFTDSVFAEDIGNFPDLNIAEAINRVPGIQLTREVDGSGMNVAIRGLSTNFTRIGLNSTQVAGASSGRTDAQNHREVDLDLFPSELLNRRDVNKTPMARMIEGGISGTVNMRSAIVRQPGNRGELPSAGSLSLL